MIRKQQRPVQGIGLCFARASVAFFACRRSLESAVRLRYNIFEKSFQMADEIAGFIRQIYGTGSEEASGQIGADA